MTINFPQRPEELEAVACVVAARFSKVLREWLTPWHMTEAILRNRAETNSGVCHSHDHCDANMAMHEAMAELWPEKDYFSDDRHTFETGEEDVEILLWNRAWDLAKEWEFSTDPAIYEKTPAP